MTKDPVTFAHHQAVGAYRRWQPVAFDAPPEPPAAPEPEPEAQATAPEESPPAPAFSLPTVAEIEAIHEEARHQGFEEGFAEGRDKGFIEGHEKGVAEGRQAGYEEGSRAAEVEAKTLHELVTGLGDALSHLDSEVAEELMALAIEIARKVVQHTLAVSPETIVNVIRVALQSLPQGRSNIILHPEDAALARRRLGELLEQSDALIIEDDRLSRGGCRIETASTEIDGTMETRWRRVLDSLGRNCAPWGKTESTLTVTSSPSPGGETPSSPDNS